MNKDNFVRSPSKFQLIINDNKYKSVKTNEFFMPEISLDFSFSKHAINRVIERFNFINYNILVNEIRSIITSIKSVKNTLAKKHKIKTKSGFRIKREKSTFASDIVEYFYVVSYRGIRYVFAELKYQNDKKYYCFENNRINELTDKLPDKYFRLITCYIEEFNI